ncbi:MAG: hypothetical protein HQ515_08490 [Phycisphaeraceae bacterium]|nr:hypothetical protein [Phycisphaeraceae bacterium]
MRKTCYFLIVFPMLLGAVSCKKNATEPPPMWQDVKLSDLEPPGDPDSNGLQPIAGVNLDIHCFELPVDQIKTLGPVWNPLTKQGIRFKNALSFQGNGLQLSRTKINKLSWILGSLEKAQAIKITISSIILAEDYDSDFMITALPRSHTISFLDMKGDTQSASVGPGQLNLRLKAQKTKGSPYPNRITGYPMVTVPSHKGIKKLDQLSRQYEAAFLSSSFSASVLPGDVFLLGPEEFFGEITTLGGLFFFNPQGRFFDSPRAGAPPVAKPTVRVYMILCTRIQ